MSERYWAKRSAGAKDLTHAGKSSGNQRAHGPLFLGFLHTRFGGTLALRASGESFDGHGKERPQAAQGKQADGDPQQAVIEEDARRIAAEIPREQEGILFDDGPVAGDVVKEDEADRIENAGPEVFQRAGGGEDGHAR